MVIDCPRHQEYRHQLVSPSSAVSSNSCNSQSIIIGNTSKSSDFVSISDSNRAPVQQFKVEPTAEEEDGPTPPAAVLQQTHQSVADSVAAAVAAAISEEDVMVAENLDGQHRQQVHPLLIDADTSNNKMCFEFSDVSASDEAGEGHTILLSSATAGGESIPSGAAENASGHNQHHITTLESASLASALAAAGGYIVLDQEDFKACGGLFSRDHQGRIPLMHSLSMEPSRWDLSTFLNFSSSQQASAYGVSAGGPGGAFQPASSVAGSVNSSSLGTHLGGHSSASSGATPIPGSAFHSGHPGHSHHGGSHHVQGHHMAGLGQSNDAAASLAAMSAAHLPYPHNAHAHHQAAAAHHHAMAAAAANHPYSTHHAAASGHHSAVMAAAVAAAAAAGSTPGGPSACLPTPATVGSHLGYGQSASNPYASAGYSSLAAAAAGDPLHETTGSSLTSVSTPSSASPSVTSAAAIGRFTSAGGTITTMSSSGATHQTDLICQPQDPYFPTGGLNGSGSHHSSGHFLLPIPGSTSGPVHGSFRADDLYYHVPVSAAVSSAHTVNGVPTTGAEGGPGFLSSILDEDFRQMTVASGGSSVHHLGGSDSMGGGAPSSRESRARRDEVATGTGGASSTPGAANGGTPGGVSAASRTPEWTGLAPHPSLINTAGSGHPFGTDINSRTEASEQERGSSRDDRSPSASSVSATNGNGTNVPPQKKHQFYGRRTGSFQDNPSDDVREDMLTSSSTGVVEVKSSEFLPPDVGTSNWLITSPSNLTSLSGPPGITSIAGNSSAVGHLSPQLPVPAALHGAAAAAAAAAAAVGHHHPGAHSHHQTAYQNSSYVIDPTSNGLGLGASAANFAGAAGANWHQTMQPTHQGFSFDPVKYQCSYDYSGTVRHPALDPQVTGLNSIQHNHSYSAPFPEPSGLLRSHHVPLPISSSSSTGSRAGSKYSKEESQACRDEKRAAELKIPISMEDIVNLPMDEFNERLSKYDLTEVQLSLIRDIRRRGKNKVAAQNCRKRKLDQILTLADEVTQFRTKRERIGQELDNLLQRRQSLASRYASLYRHITQHLRDGDGKLLNPYEYVLEHTGEDARVVVMPISSSTAAQIVKPIDHHDVHEAHHHHPPHQGYDHPTYTSLAPSGTGSYQGEMVFASSADGSGYLKRETGMDGSRA